MDPNATLEQIRATADRVLGPDWSQEPAPDLELIVSTMAADFDALDRWLTSGGFLPVSWERKR